MSKTEQILDYLRTRDGIPPTVREIRDALDISSTSVVFYHLDKLEEQGLISRQPGKARTIQVVKKASDLLIVIDLPWIPQEEVRGNSRVVWQVKARLVSELVDRGVEYGLVAKQDHPEYEYPIKGPLAIEITAWNTKRIDHENVLIGYKGFLDGLQMVVKRDEYGDVPGAGLIVEDSQFVTSTVKPRIGDPKTRIIITRTDY